MSHPPSSAFRHRHIGIASEELDEMLEVIGVDTMGQLIDETVPKRIRQTDPLDIPKAMTEYEYLQHIRAIGRRNQLFKNYIGQGYYGTITPSVIARNIFENPGWYTQYTPYQAEISQGRLEALLNFQTVVSDLTGLPIANASLLDEGTAAAEAMAMFFGAKNKRRRTDPATRFFVDNGVFDHTIDVIRSRAIPLQIEVVVGDWQAVELTSSFFGALIQYPNKGGGVEDFQAFIARCQALEIYTCAATDLLSLCLLKAPGDWGIDVAVGSSQRFGVPMGFGGPHAAFFATHDTFKRLIPGRIIGLSVDSRGEPALRMALQTREQHIKRERATSNICTAQALLAVMAGMYAVYHGADGLREIALRVHGLTQSLERGLRSAGWSLRYEHYFDTIAVACAAEEQSAIRALAESASLNFFYDQYGVQISLDETTTSADVEAICSIFERAGTQVVHSAINGTEHLSIPLALQRSSAYLTHSVFRMYRTETQLMRYIKRLENRDLSLVHSMIPLGSCTMKLNAATQLVPVSWASFAHMHPFAPIEQAAGYRQIFDELEAYLCTITGFTACSLQPNSGAQGEFTGLMVIRSYHQGRGEQARNIALIPSSAHGTNPASAVMAGMKVVVVQCDEKGNIDLEDLRAKCQEHGSHLAALMITYPSTHGVFETKIREMCQMVHDAGGLVYMDGANMNAQVGLTSPGQIGADVCHLNLHKTFSIPHGGGGPGMGPICVNERLEPYLPNHRYADCGGQTGIPAVAAAPWGSASILLISYAYIRLLGRSGLTEASKYAILNANYLKSKLEAHYSILYTGAFGRSGHEFIVDLRAYRQAGVRAEDIAKRLVDYGFHAPTLSFPVAETIMIEPTESEDKAELDRFCEAMIEIRREIDDVVSGRVDIESSVLRHAPHTMDMIAADTWAHTYSRSEAAYPVEYLRKGHKFWPWVGRVDNAHGDRNLICTCPPIEAYVDEPVEND